MRAATFAGVLTAGQVLWAIERDRAPHTAGPGTQLPDAEGVRHVRLASDLLSKFWGRPIAIEAGVVLPPDHDAQRRDAPVCYAIHGFGGSHRDAWRFGPGLRRAMQEDGYPRLIYVFLNASCPLGHHEFADSVNNGPWGEALTREFIPALEQQVGAAGSPAGRFLTGHSSGGWSSLWLQVNYPDFFAGSWAVAPDPVDFRDFSGVDIYTFQNAYFDPSGNETRLIRDGQGGWAMTIKEYAQREAARREYGGQFASFDAVFGPRGEDGRPWPLFDRQSGMIDPVAVEHWKQYDLRLILTRHWRQLAPRLQGKLHIYMGTEDTFHLEGAVRLLQAELEQLGSDAQVVLVPDRDHYNLLHPHPQLWPHGLRPHIHRAMWDRWQAAADRVVPAQRGNHLP